MTDEQGIQNDVTLKMIAGSLIDVVKNKFDFF